MQHIQLRTTGYSVMDRQFRGWNGTQASPSSGEGNVSIHQRSGNLETDSRDSTGFIIGAEGLATQEYQDGGDIEFDWKIN